MSMRKLNGDGAKFENQGGVLVVDLTNDYGTLRFIFEDGWAYMIAVMENGKVLKTDSVYVEEVIKAMKPKASQDDQAEEEPESEDA